MPSFRIMAIALALVGALGVARADVYRWVDPDGHVQYSDRWVPGSQLIKIDRTHIAADAPPASRDTSEQKKPDSPSDPVAEQEAARTVKLDVAKSREQDCKEATKVYDTAVHSRRLFKTGKNGEREYISDAEADTYRMQAFNNKQAACGAK